jgi:hypothetical protein
MGDVIPMPRKQTAEDMFYEYVSLLGERDQSKGRPFRENPYPEGSMEREAWHRGWWKGFAAINLPGAIEVDKNV